eukprot:1443948-Pleurochrysis_carterae.AAC.13
MGISANVCGSEHARHDGHLTRLYVLSVLSLCLTICAMKTVSWPCADELSVLCPHFGGSAQCCGLSSHLRRGRGLRARVCRWCSRRSSSSLIPRSMAGCVRCRTGSVRAAAQMRGKANGAALRWWRGEACARCLDDRGCAVGRERLIAWLVRAMRQTRVAWSSAALSVLLS